MLSQRQKDDLNRAVADYLAANNFKETLEAFAKEAQLPAPLDALLADKKNAGVLEKKWTTVVRLQKKIVELEAQLEKKEQELTQAQAGGGFKGFSGAAGEKRRPPSGFPGRPRSTRSQVGFGLSPNYLRLAW